MKDIARDVFYVVAPTYKNIETTIKTWDEKPEYTYSSDQELLKFAIGFLTVEYRDYMKDCKSQSEELYSYIDYTKSPGFPGNYFNITTKRELLSDPGYRKFCEENNHYYIPKLPVWTASPKKEFKLMEDILKDKIRMFQIPPFELLRSQLKFGKRISLRLKMEKWSAYGFNPYSGGANGLAMQLLTKPWRFIYDVSGWDKFLPVMNELYSVIKQNCGYDEWSYFEKSEFDWMVQNTVNHILKMPDGSTYLKKYGNPSGSGCTTRDNILAHVMILSYALAEAYRKKNGVMPDYSLLAQQIIYLFGDDSICAVDDEFSFICNEEFLAEVYGRFGLKLKFFVGGFEEPLENLSFLGFTFKKIKKFYYPCYDVVRLASSMIYEDADTLDRSAHLSKAYVLTIMSYPTQHFGIFNKAYKNLLDSVSKPLDETEASLKRMGPVTERMCEMVYQGLEASIFSDFFYSIGGGTKFDYVDLKPSDAWGETPQRFSQ